MRWVITEYENRLLTYQQRFGKSGSGHGNGVLNHTHQNISWSESIIHNEEFCYMFSGTFTESFTIHIPYVNLDWKNYATTSLDHRYRQMFAAQVRSCDKLNIIEESVDCLWSYLGTPRYHLPDNFLAFGAQRWCR